MTKSVLKSHVKQLVMESNQVHIQGLVLVMSVAETLVDLITHEGQRTGRLSWLELHQFQLSSAQKIEKLSVQPLSEKELLALSALNAILCFRQLDEAFPDSRDIVVDLCRLVANNLLK